MVVSSTSGNCAEDYSQFCKTIQGRWADRLLSMVKIKKGDTCLDIGCGTGDITTSKLIEKVGDSGQVIAFDPDEKRLDNARGNYKNSNVNFTCGMISDLNLKEETVNVAVSNMVFHWIPPKLKLETSECLHKVLKKNGFFALTAHPKISLSHLKFIPFFDDEKKKLLDETLFFADENEYRKIFENVGFDITAFDTITSELNFPSVGSLLTFLDARSFGLFDFKDVYKKYGNEIDLPLDNNGRLFEDFTIFYIVLKKIN